MNKKIIKKENLIVKKKSKKKQEVITGILFKHKKGFGFVTPEDGVDNDVYISAYDINGAMNGDKVEVALLHKSIGHDSREGSISKILNRGTVEVVGTFQNNSKYGFVVPYDRKIHDDIFILKKDFNGAHKGDKVVAQITKYPDIEGSAEGKVTEIISREGEIGGDIKALIRSYNLFQTFPSKVNAEAKAVSKEGLDEAFVMTDIGTRRDLRNKTIITIDGADSKDFDDAVSIEKLGNGNYLLSVHIADVTHYVAEGGPLDKEALKRGTSVYLIDQVIPMLPKALSNGICSLNPDVDRYTLSIDMEIDEMGKVVNHDIYESMIRSKARMVYSDVSDMLENEDKELILKYQDIYDDILQMNILARRLRLKKEARGSLDFDFDEAYITLNDRGIPVSVDIAERRTANKLIEEFMLLANETVAEHFYWLELPFIYRVHEKPSLDKMEEFKIFLRSFGIILRGASENIHPKALNEILEQVKGKPYESVVNTIMLRSMKKAFYDTECQGHFGLSLKYYCHFTSPIRRYPDLMIHRIIKLSINGQLDAKVIKSLKRKTKDASENSSAMERQAQELEREVEKLKKAEYMSYHIGETYQGIVSGVTGYGIYVELENTIEGMIRVEYMIDDFYDYIASNYRLVGRHTGKIFTLGDKVKILVQSVSLENREINFTLIN